MLPDLNLSLRLIYKYGMDPKLFKQRLEQFAELKQLKAPKTAAIRQTGEPETVFRGGEEFSVDQDNNPTIGWGIKKIKPHVAVCEDCRRVVEDRCVEIRRYDTPVKHWRSHCKPCGMVENPYTKEFSITVKQSGYTYICWLENKPQPYFDENQEEKSSHLTAVFKKPAK